MSFRKKHVQKLQERAKAMVAKMAKKKEEKAALETSTEPQPSTSSANLPPPSTTTSTPNTPPPTTCAIKKTSAVKRKSFVTSEKKEIEQKEDDTCCVFSLANVASFISGLCCPKCLTPNVKIKYIKHQLDIYTHIYCSECDHYNYDDTPKAKKVKVENGNKYFPKTLNFV